MIIPFAFCQWYLNVNYWRIMQDVVIGPDTFSGKELLYQTDESGTLVQRSPYDTNKRYMNGAYYISQYQTLEELMINHWEVML